MKYTFAFIFFARLFSGTTLVAADLETLTLRGGRSEVYPALITALANAADLTDHQNRRSIARSLRINFEKNPSSFIENSEVFHQILEFTKTKISDHLDHLLENGVSSITVDFSPKLSASLAQLPANRVFEYLNKTHGASFFYIDNYPIAMKNKNYCVSSCPTLRVFGRIINFENLNMENLLSIVLQMPPLIVVNGSTPYMSSLELPDIFETSELKIAVKNSLMNNGASYAELSIEKLKTLCGRLNKNIDLRYE